MREGKTQRLVKRPGYWSKSKRQEHEGGLEKKKARTDKRDILFVCDPTIKQIYSGEILKKRSL